MSSERNFLFNSGGNEQWDFLLDNDGRVSVTHFVGDDVEFSGMSMLDEDRSETLWKLIEEADIPNLDFSNDCNSDSDIPFRFDYMKGDVYGSIKCLAKDALKKETLLKLVEEIKKVIEIMSGKKINFEN